MSQSLTFQGMRNRPIIALTRGMSSVAGGNARAAFVDQGHGPDLPVPFVNKVERQSWH
jgi:hypothetical protein